MDPPSPSAPRSEFSRTKRWAVTLAATVASTYLLDAIRHGGRRCPRRRAAAPRRRSLARRGVPRRNVRRLGRSASGSTSPRTGDCSRRRARVRAHSRRPRTIWPASAVGATRARRLASQAGYLATELVKEIPYYAGAFGAALVSDSVSSNDALVFLAGTNLGAAAYEYALGRLTRMFFLRLRSASGRPRGTARAASRSYQLGASRRLGGHGLRRARHRRRRAEARDRRRARAARAAERPSPARSAPRAGRRCRSRACRRA